jgi:hypothetical protein
MKYGFILILMLCLFVSASRAKRQPAATVSLANEKVYINPIVDSSALQTFDGWPKEQSSQKLLSVHFRDCWKNLFAEFKRCEKLGFYEMVDDSSAATVRIRLVVRPYSVSKDTLRFPVGIELRHTTGMDTYTNSIEAAGVYRAKSKPKSAFHRLDYLLGDFRRHFPYARVTALFYTPLP